MELEVPRVGEAGVAESSVNAEPIDADAFVVSGRAYSIVVPSDSDHVMHDGSPVLGREDAPRGADSGTAAGTRDSSAGDGQDDKNTGEQGIAGRRASAAAGEERMGPACASG